MLEEYYIWQKIFTTKDELELKTLINLVVTDDIAREFVMDKIIDLNKKEIIKVNINIDKNLEYINKDELSDLIVRKIINETKKY